MYYYILLSQHRTALRRVHVRACVMALKLCMKLTLIWTSAVTTVKSRIRFFTHPELVKFTRTRTRFRSLRHRRMRYYFISVCVFVYVLFLTYLSTKNEIK